MFKYLKNTAFFLCHIPFFIMLISAWGNFEISSFIICAFCIAGSAIAYRLCGSFSEKNSVILQIVLWFVSVVLMICSGWLLAVEPAWDFGRIYHGALDITTNGTLTYTMPYYLESYNNFFITLCLVPWFIVMSVLGIEPLYSGIILNVILMALAQLFAVWAVNIAFSPKDGLFLQLFFTAFVPFYTYAPIFYTDTFSMPFITFVLLVYVVVKEKKVSGKMAPVLYILAGLAAFVGYKLKPTAALVLIAVIIFSVLDNYRENTINIIAACMTVCICFMGYSVFENRTTLIDLSDIDDYRLPPEHYVMMGLRNKGGYNPDDHYFSLSFDNIDDRKAANVQQIKERMAAYGTTGYIKFLAGKIRYT